MSRSSSWWIETVPDESRVRLTVDESLRLATLEFTAADTGNAIDWRFVEELDSATASVEHLAEAGGVNALLLRSEGRHFCVGGDLREFPSDPARATPHIQAMATIAHRSTDRLARLMIPIVARIQGAAAGAGVGFALLADLPVASDRASFTLAYAAVGLVPDAGVSWSLPRLIGEKRALDLLLTNRRVDAQEALALGLVARVVPESDLDITIDELIRTLLSLPGDMLRQNKRLLRASATNTLTDQLAQEAGDIARLAASPFAQSRIAGMVGGAEAGAAARRDSPGVSA